MRKIHDLALGAALLIVGGACSAQYTPIPFAEIQANAELSAVPARELASSLDSGSASGASSSAPSSATASSAASIVRALPVKGRRTLGAKYFLLNGLHLGMASLDLALAQHCIAEHRCREGNPLMPPSLAGRVSVEVALVGFGSLLSGKLKLQGSKQWWIAPAVGIAAHGAGVATGLAHQ